MSTVDEKEYLLGTQDDELARLGLQHRIWSAQAFALWERAGFGAGARILDLGCGPGYATLDLASLVGQRGHVLAIDESPRFIQRIKAVAGALGVTNVEARVGDATRLDLAPASLDGAYMRWLLCFLKEPEKPLASVAEALRPGGRIAITDYFNYHTMSLAPRGPALARVVAAVVESWNASGGDLDVAARLPGMLAGLGLRVREIRPIVRAARPGTSLWQWPTTFFHGYAPKLVQMGFLTNAERLAFEAEWREWSDNPNAFFSTPPVYDIIAEKP